MYADIIFYMHWIPVRFGHLSDAHVKFKSRNPTPKQKLEVIWWILHEDPKEETELVMLAKTTYTRMFSFLQVQVTPLRFYERPTFLSVFTNLQKKKKAKIVFSIWFAISCSRGSSKSVASQVPSHHDATIASSCVCEHLCCISILCISALTVC